MKLERYIVFILMAGIAFSCKKKTYPPSTVESEPSFYFNATIDNAPVSLAAGIDNYYMYSSYLQEVNGVYGFIADLRQANCSNCPNSLYIKINDSRVTAFGAPALIDSALAVSSFSLNAGSSYSVQFQSTYNKTAASYFWNFGDGTTSTLANPLHIYEKQGIYNVGLTINGTNGCVSSINNVHKIGFPPTACITSASASATGNSVAFTSTTQGANPLSYLWNFGDGSTSTQQNPVHNYSLKGSYPVTLKVTDGFGDVSTTKLNVVTQTDVSSCAANFNAVSTLSVANSLDLSQIVIRWTDANGTVYTSSNYQQPASSYFQVVSAENFTPNENNEPTKKVRIKFSCNVYNGSVVKSIQNAEATICVAYN